MSAGNLYIQLKLKCLLLSSKNEHKSKTIITMQFSKCRIKKLIEF